MSKQHVRPGRQGRQDRIVRAMYPPETPSQTFNPETGEWSKS